VRHIDEINACSIEIGGTFGVADDPPDTELVVDEEEDTDA